MDPPSIGSTFAVDPTILLSPRQRAVDLLVERATEGLAPAREAELGELLASQPDLDPESFELAAAAIDLACTVIDEPVPEGLSLRLAVQARELDLEPGVG